MTVTDRTDATEQEFRSRVAPFEGAPTPPEVREAAVVEEVARAIHDADEWDCSVDWPCANANLWRRLAAAAVAGYRAAQDGGAEEADANGCPDRQHHGVDCPGDACRFAALAPQAGEQPSGFRKRPVDLTPAGPGQEVCGERFGRYGVCDLPKGHPPIAEAMGWLHSQDAL